MAAELLGQFEAEIELLTLIPSHSGRFEVTANGTLVYSKQKTGRHADKGEGARLLNEYLLKNNA